MPFPEPPIKESEWWWNMDILIQLTRIKSIKVKLKDPSSHTVDITSFFSKIVSVCSNFKKKKRNISQTVEV